MKKKPESKEVLAAWNRVPRAIDNAIRGSKEKDLDLRGGSEGWSIRETVHHLVEANLVASNIIIAALAMNGYNYDWTWVNPSKAWMRRVGYGTAPVEPAIETLRALCRYISGLVAAKPGALTCKVKLNDTPGATRYVMSVEKILWQEVTHAEEHLQDASHLLRKSLLGLHSHRAKLAIIVGGFAGGCIGATIVFWYTFLEFDPITIMLPIGLLYFPGGTFAQARAVVLLK